MAADRRVPVRGRTRILVVDDDPLIRDLLRAVIEDGDYELVEAQDGEEALMLARAEPPDVVVLDVMMPGVNGYQVCKTFRADPDLRGARIVMLTARNTDWDRDEAQRAGADDFFAKPFSPLDLLEVLTQKKGTPVGR